MFCWDSDKLISYPTLMEKHKVFFTILSVQYFVFYESLIRSIQNCQILTIYTHFESFLYSYSVPDVKPCFISSVNLKANVRGA